VKVKRNCNLLTPESSRKDSKMTFRVREGNNDLLIHKSIVPLAYKLGHMSSFETIELAYTLANGLFRILGSSWGNYMENGNISVGIRTENEWIIMLRASQGEQSLEDILALARREVPYSSSKLDQHCQIVRLGLILQTLGLCVKTPFRSTRLFTSADVAHRGRTYPEPDSQVCKRDSDVRERMGGEFSDIVFHCLSVFAKEDLLKKDDLGHHFESKILIP
jgi:hypothetical protein